MTDNADDDLTEIATAFSRAANTARRLPSEQRLGYFSLWPPIVRSSFEALAAEDLPAPYFPPSPQAIEQMLQAMRWIQVLEPQARHLVWMRAQGWGWSAISKRFGCDRTTAWRRWKAALETVANHHGCQ
ncbi:DUF6362 family protein [Orrella sp. 11846]|uniref:DUF6362 family protein n=1 Tax=Orrella sp. 11846 TaxID=3409913 RepID=UPI003B5CCD06